MPKRTPAAVLFVGPPLLVFLVGWGSRINGLRTRRR